LAQGAVIQAVAGPCLLVPDHAAVVGADIDMGGGVEEGLMISNISREPSEGEWLASRNFFSPRYFTLPHMGAGNAAHFAEMADGFGISLRRGGDQGALHRQRLLAGLPPA
jgi:hypothetical protein